MALELEKELSNGLTAKYWSITKIETSGDEVKAVLELHVSKELKDAGKSSVQKKHVRLTLPKAEIITSNLYELVYNEVKKSDKPYDDIEINEFVDALDV